MSEPSIRVAVVGVGHVGRHHARILDSLPDVDLVATVDLDERRALDDRFALKVFLDLPTRSQYESILLDYARRAGVAEQEGRLLDAFRVWCLRNNHDLVGGRTARDFILSRYPEADRRGGGSGS